MKIPTKAPNELSKKSGLWWLEVVNQFGLKTAGEHAVLTEAALSLDRIAECSKTIKIDGMFVSGQRGKVAHPATRLELQHRALVLQACRQLGISAPVEE